MRTLQDHLEGDGTRWIVTKDPEIFPGSDAFARSDIPEEASGLGYPLRFNQFGLTSAQFLLGPLAVLDIRRRAIPFDNVAILVAQRHASKQEPAIFAVETP